MNTFVVEEFERFPLVTFYTVRWDEAELSETDKFKVKTYQVIQEDNQSRSPISPDGPSFAPTSWIPHLVRCKVEGVDLGFRQVVLSSNIALWLVSGKSW